jgi:predicted membrane-bound mannosyltransferase/DNA-binding beta-propeller fold protein YncE
MTVAAKTPSKPTSRLNIWTALYVAILILAVVTRLYALGDRAVSHDETTHAKYSWNLYSGRGFRHDPLMHGPLLFEATALFYGLLGVNDFAARFYTALTGIALVMLPWLYHKWLGRVGSVLASLMLLISPSITYYSRYTRHDVPIMLYAGLLLWSILQYLDRGQSRWLRWAGVFFALMYASKENAYIYTAIFLALLALGFLVRVLRSRWHRPKLIPVVAGLLVAALLAGALFAFSFRDAQVIEEGEGNAAIGSTVVPVWGQLAAGLSLIALLLGLVMAKQAIGEQTLRHMRLFDVLMVLGTFTLPLGSALLMRFIAGVDIPLLYQGMMAASLAGVPASSLVGAFLTLGVTVGISFWFGLWWDRRQWPTIAVIHYGVFFLLYSTFLTYGWGALTGLVGGLAYWMAQQQVERGTQPWYYYEMVGSLYEYLPLLVSAVGGAFFVGRSLLHRGQGAAGFGGANLDGVPYEEETVSPQAIPAFLLAWALLSWLGYTIAGEKMPWLFVHIAFPHIGLAAWTLDQLVGRGRQEWLRAKRGWLVPVSMIFLVLAWLAFRDSSGSIRQILEQSGAGEQLAFTIAQLEPIGRTAGGLVGIVIFSGLLIYALGELGMRRSLRWIALTLILCLAALTVRTMVMLSFINDELATEYMVFAHATPDVNHALETIRDVSWRLTGTPDQVKVAYSKEVAWPFYWYMDSLYPNNVYFITPDAETLADSAVILAARSEWGTVEAVIGDAYDATDYKHIWWPIEDYKNLTWDRLKRAITEPERRRALWDIAWARDYERYARLRNPDDPFTLTTWPHRQEFRIYVRRDLGDRIWSYELGSDGEATTAGDGVSRAGPDPYQGEEQIAAVTGSWALTDVAPVGVATAPDGTIYVTDGAGHRIWQIGPDRETLVSFGSYGTGPGLFNQPTGLAVDEQGNLYVADTWNHRIQKLSPSGEALLSWGRLARVEVQDRTGFGAFYGPRGVALGPEGHVYVTDTGNSRVQVFDDTGGFLRAFGGAGQGPGMLREPTGIALDAAGQVYVVDAWNRRIQVFTAEGLYLREWDVPVWIAADSPQALGIAVMGDYVLITDPVYRRIILFNTEGDLLVAYGFGDLSVLPVALAAADSSVVVADGLESQVFRFSIPADLDP